MSSQELASTLIPQLCCTETDVNCSKSDFCQTLRETPQSLGFNNSDQFCDWFENSGCSDLVENPQASMSEFWIHRQCSGMTAENLSAARTFCAGVRSVAQSAPPTTPPPAGGSGDDSGINWLSDGAIATGIATAILYAKRFLNVMKEIGQKATEAGENLGAPTRLLRAINKELLSLLQETRKFFSETVVEWGKFVGDLVTLRIFKKKKSKGEKNVQQNDRPDRFHTLPYMKLDSVVTHPIVGAPRRSVVLEQINGLLERDEKYKVQKEVFEKLGVVGQFFLAKIAIDTWNNMWQFGSPEEKEEANRLAITDTSPYIGKLPFRFLLKRIIERYLRPSMIDALRAAALEALAEGIVPHQENVETQVLSNTNFWSQVNELLIGSNVNLTDRSELVKYLAARLIYRWGQSNLKQKTDSMNIDEFPREGHLPSLYVESSLEEIVNGNNLQHIFRLAPFYAQILSFKPELQSFGFDIVNKRAERLLSAWEMSADYIEEIFGEIDAQGHVDQTVIALMRSSLDVGIAQRERSEPAAESWRYDATEIKLLEGVNLSRVMKLLVQENSQLAYYPEILERRARALIEDWSGMKPEFRNGFAAKDARDGYEVDDGEPSINFAKFWYRINGEIGVSGRSSINPGEGPGRGGQNNGGGAAQGGGSTVTGTFDPNKASSGAQGARRTAEIPLTRSTYVARARQRAIVSGGLLCRRPASSTANLFRTLFAVHRPALVTVR